MVRFALLSSLVGTAATIGLFTAAIVLRLRLLAYRRAEEAFIANWRPLLTQIAVCGIDPDTDRRLSAIPAPSRQDWRFLLNEWNVMQDSLKGSARQHLVRAGYTLRMDQAAWALLGNRRSMGDQLLAVVTLGHLGDTGAWQEIAARLDSGSSLLALMAAKALCNIDPDRAAPLVLDRVVQRDDWAGARVASVLQEAGAGAISRPLRDAILEGGPAAQEKLIGFLPMAYKAVSSHVIHELLDAEMADDRVVGACLKVAHGPLELPHLRRLIRHPRWHVRMRAATALGRLGAEEDCPRLLELLADQEWWVRYRAAEALIGLPFLDRGALERIRDGITDRYGRDMFDQVLAEREAA
jgi:hypothetical protein